MQLTTMAMKITEKNWPVAVAVLGSSFASLPFPEVAGSFVVINTFGRPYRRPMSMAYRASRRDELVLTNIIMSAEDFAWEYDYDKRKKNTEEFFPVTLINSPKPPEKRRTSRDERIDQHLMALASEIQEPPELLEDEG